MKIRTKVPGCLAETTPPHANDINRQMHQRQSVHSVHYPAPRRDHTSTSRMYIQPLKSKLYRTRSPGLSIRVCQLEYNKDYRIPKPLHKYQCQWTTQCLAAFTMKPCSLMYHLHSSTNRFVSGTPLALMAQKNPPVLLQRHRQGG